MEENQSTYTNINLRKDNAGESSQIDVFKSPEGESELFMLPAEALFYALPYMSLQELLSMEQVCRASRKWVREGVLLWRTLCVEWPLNNSLTDEILIQLSKRSNGELECVCLVNCLTVTELAVEQIVMASPRLTKLFIPGCSRITADGVVNMVRAHKNERDPGMPGIKELKLKDIIGLTEHHVQSLLDILDIPKASHSHYKPRLYKNNHGSLLSDDQRPIDVDVCPKCHNIRMVYECSRDTCQEKQECRACLFCTARCAECGVCLKDGEQEDTICLDYLCSDCWLRLPKCSHCNKPACGNHSSTSFEVHGSSLLCVNCVDPSLNPGDSEYDL